MINDQPAILKD